jgi:hypothetical protein
MAQSAETMPMRVQNDTPVHTLTQTFNVAGEMVLTCPDCGHSARFNLSTMERVTDRMGDINARHMWTAPGVNIEHIGCTSTPDQKGPDQVDPTGLVEGAAACCGLQPSPHTV